MKTFRLPRSDVFDALHEQTRQHILLLDGG